MQSTFNIQQLRQKYDALPKKIRYGTAGFRDKAENLEYVAYKVGAFVSLLNHISPSNVLGIVVSASHNKIQDNGLKISNFSGNMLEQMYEEEVEQFVDKEDMERGIELFKAFLLSKKKTFFTSQVCVCVGGDNRPSTNRILQLVKAGIKSQGGTPLDFGVTTTPQLFFYVQYINKHVKPKMLETDLQAEQAKFIAPKYWESFIEIFKATQKYHKFKEVKERVVDSANGVGGSILPKFLEGLKEYLNVTLINNTHPELLNEKCGADYVYTNKTFPSEYKKAEHNSLVSFDGDADRIVLFYEDNGELKLIDGDRIGVLFTTFYKNLVERLREETNKINESNCMEIKLPLDNVKIGFIQTYYANTASSNYLKSKFNIDPVFAATGVKHLHQKAAKFDVGVYFEANGHGTALFETGLPEKVSAMLINRDILEESVKTYNPDFHGKLIKYFDFLDYFYNSCQLPNRAAGDAICDFLLIENALDYLGMTYKDLGELYQDLKSSTTKITVKNKYALKVTEIEDRVLEPEGLQDKIDDIIKKHGGVKAFVRASGTQDLLRLHVEADDQAKIKKIQQEITQLIVTDTALNS